MRIHPLATFGLFLLVFLALGVAVLQFRLTSGEIPRTRITLGSAGEIHPLDKVLLDNLSYLSNRNTFDSLFVPRREATLEPFYLQTCQVTQSEFNRFAQWVQFNAEWRSFSHPDEPPEQTYRSNFFEHKILGRLQAPVTGINFYQAHAYCAAAGGRLPTSDEWEAAAAGKEGRIYPWGDAFEASPWKYRNPLLNVAQPCGVYAASDTPNKVSDLGGGASEWASDTEGNAGWLRGGNALNKPFALHALNLVAKEAPPRFASQFVGFRCAFDQPPPSTPWGKTHASVYIPGGRYQLGTPPLARIPGLARQLDQSLIDIAPLFKRPRQGEFEVSTYEITVAQYAGFLRDPLVALGLFANSAEPSGHSYKPLNWEKQKNNPDHPVVGTSWWDAYAFAKWAGGRLPSMQEWNRLFSGVQPRLYPWGDDYREGLAVVRERNLLTAPAPVGDSRDKSPLGVYALAGNVSEWTSSVYFANQEQNMVIKGGNYLLEGDEAARFDYVARAPAYHRSAAIGFRVIFN